MERKQYSNEDALRILGKIDIYLHDGIDVLSVCRKAGDVRFFMLENFFN